MPLLARPTATARDGRAARGRARSALTAEVLRFCAVGALSYGLGIGLAALFHEVSAVPPQIAVALSLAIVLLTNFTLARRFIFRSSGALHDELVRFALTSATMRGFEYLAFLALFEGLAIQYLAAMTIAMAVSTSLKFVLYKRLVFRGASARTAPRPRPD